MGRGLGVNQASSLMLRLPIDFGVFCPETSEEMTSLPRRSSVQNATLARASHRGARAPKTFRSCLQLRIFSIFLLLLFFFLSFEETSARASNLEIFYHAIVSPC